MYKPIELEALLEAYKSMSSEIELEPVCKKVLEIVMEHSGATSGTLFLKEEEDFYIASQIKDKERITQPAEEEFLGKLLYYMSNSREPLVLHPLCKSGTFESEPFIQENNTLSILALPLLHKASLIGILYLENNVCSQAFTKRILFFTTSLASHAANSIYNAKLFHELNAKVMHRTDELEKANTNLEKANHELESEGRKRMELLSNISHDLKNPLTSLHGYIEAMLDGIVISPEKQRTYLKRSKEKLASLNRLIEDLFMLSQLQYGDMSLVKEIVSIEKVFNYLCNQHEWDIKHHGLNFIRHIPIMNNNMYPLVEVDIGRLEQVFTNIVSNSLKHTESGAIIINLRIKEDFVVFEINDSGTGIPSDEIDNIFNRAFTGKSNGTLAGHGLGLSISKEIILHHKGEIWAESVLGKGTTIFFSLPILTLEKTILDEMKKTGDI